jgi:hypothetical protein
MSEVRVNKISPRSGTTVTLGDNGDTISIPSGVTLDASSGGLAGTLTTAAQPNITSVGTLTSFTSTGIDDNATSTAITINSSEQVGIGTTSPSEILHIEGNSPYLVISNTGENVGGIKMYDSGGVATQYFNLTYDSGASNEVSFDTGASGEYTFNVNTAEKMRIDSSGNVGIGTSSPTPPTAYGGLHINSQYPVLKLSSTTSGTGVADGFTVRINSTDDAQLWHYENKNMSFATNNAERMRITSSGNVGIGTTAPTEVLHVVGDILATGGDFKSDANNYLGFSNNTFARFVINDSEKMRINSSGNVGIGTSSPSTKLEVSSSGDTIIKSKATTNNVLGGFEAHNNTGTSYLKVFQLGSAYGGTTFGGVTGNDQALIEAQAATSLVFSTQGGTPDIIFAPARTARMTIKNNGNVLVGTTSLIGDSSRLNISYTYTNSGIGLKSDTTSTHNAIMFVNPNGTVGTITTSASATAYNTSSDYRLKENVTYNFDATTRLKQLKPARFNFIRDANRTVDGFLAHEVQDIIPEAITGQKDEVRDFGNIVDENNNIIHENVNENFEKEDGHTWVKTETKPVYQGIDQSKLVPLLVKVCQEQQTKIEELEARITTLENA